MNVKIIAIAIVAILLGVVAYSYITSGETTWPWIETDDINAEGRVVIKGVSSTGEVFDLNGPGTFMMLDGTEIAQIQVTYGIKVDDISTAGQLKCCEASSIDGDYSLATHIYWFNGGGYTYDAWHTIDDETIEIDLMSQDDLWVDFATQTIDLTSLGFHTGEGQFEVSVGGSLRLQAWTDYSKAPTELRVDEQSPRIQDTAGINPVYSGWLVNGEYGLSLDWRAF